MMPAFFSTTKIASNEALPLLPYSPVCFSVFLCFLPVLRTEKNFSVGIYECWQVPNVALLGLLLFQISPSQLHEVSVEVPRPASPFITHETPLSEGTAVAVSRGNGRVIY